MTQTGAEPDRLRAALSLSPAGHVYFDTGVEAQDFLSPSTGENLRSLFAKGHDFGMLHLGLRDWEPLPPRFAFWQKFARLFITHVCQSSDQQTPISIPFPPPEELQELISRAPFMRGAEYLTVNVLTQLWQELSSCLTRELKDFKGPLEGYLNTYNSTWNLVGRVYFHLAENKDNLEKPFAFLATYTPHMTSGKVQHLPLGRALQEYAGDKNKSVLLALLLPVQKGAHQSNFVKELVDSGTIFKPLAWGAREAHQFLKEIPFFEAAGIVVRIPNWWNAKKPPRPQVAVTIGTEKGGTLGLGSLLDFDMHLALANGERLTRSEWDQILSSTENLIKIKGQWVEVDRDKLQQVLLHWENVHQQVAKEGLSFAEGMRLLAGVSSPFPEEHHLHSPSPEWSSVTAGTWLREILTTLRRPDQLDADDVLCILQKNLQAHLRPYQLTGVKWLWFLYHLKLGGCLADDMGLGKTLQILSLFVLIKYYEPHTQKQPSLLIVPASLLGNWQAEMKRFTPSLKVRMIHPSLSSQNDFASPEGRDVDLVITTYTIARRLKWLAETEWDVIVLDEAQMIKNPHTKQTQCVKSLKGKVRFTLTGTPIENRLSDLWSLFDFTSPGLLGSSQSFNQYRKNSSPLNGLPADGNDNSHFFTALRTLLSPYILRRLKNDKRILKDLPDKTELQAFCTLTKQQVGLYQNSVEELNQLLQNIEGLQRRGLVLSYLLRFKQICNHPTQYLGHGSYESEASGKFARLREICEEISLKQEKVLVFTQFREIIPALSAFLASIFGREGLILHGETPIQKRARLVADFQEEQGPPFFVLSLKAGGTGLNLTQATHVIHFDRWWNPAVEDQATDRAFRIGQKKNVLVHKFICRGTIEEKIENLITSKRTLSDEILKEDNKIVLTELSNEDLIKVVSLDIHRALGEE